MKKITHVYVAGPYRKPDPVENTHNAVKAADEIASLGFVPFIPHSATMLWHAICPRPEQYWLDYDIEWLKRCDALVRLPGESKGSDAEVAIARNLGIPVFFGVESFKFFVAAECPREGVAV